MSRSRLSLPRRRLLGTGAALLVPATALRSGPARADEDPAAGGAAGTGVDVEPVGDWLRFDEEPWREGPIELHLRTGYARPLILPEPVALVGEASLPGSTLEIDVDVAVFAPGARFDARPVELVGLESGRRYRFEVRADALGRRVPIRILPP